MVVFPQYRVLVFQEIPYCCVLCRIVSHVIPVSMLHRREITYQPCKSFFFFREKPYQSLPLLVVLSLHIIVTMDRKKKHTKLERNKLVEIIEQGNKQTEGKNKINLCKSLISITLLYAFLSSNGMILT